MCAWLLQAATAASLVSGYARLLLKGIAGGMQHRLGGRSLGVRATQYHIHAISSRAICPRLHIYACMRGRFCLHIAAYACRWRINECQLDEGCEGTLHNVQHLLAPLQLCLWLKRESLAQHAVQQVAGASNVPCKVLCLENQHGAMCSVSRTYECCMHAAGLPGIDTIFIKTAVLIA